MKIMTFNVLCGDRAGRLVSDRYPIVAELIKNENPDSVGVQEATPEWMEWLKKYLTDYDFVGVGREDGKNDGEYSAVFYKKDKFSLIDSDNFWLSDTPDVPSRGWDGACTRICTWALLENKETKQRYAHINTHLDHVGDVARQKGMELIFAEAEKMPAPAVVTGDFNFYEGSHFYKDLLDGRLADTKYTAKESDDGITFHGYDVVKDQGIIDFIFTTPEFSVDKYSIIKDKINGDYPSDHFPVTAIINL